MEIEVLTEDPPSAEQRRPLNCEGLGLGAEYDKAPLETIVEGLPGPLDREETTHEAIESKAKPKRSAKAKAVRFEGARGGEAQEPLGERSAGSAPAEPKVKAKSRAKASTRRAAEEVSLAQEAPIKEPAKEPVRNFRQKRLRLSIIGKRRTGLRAVHREEVDLPVLGIGLSLHRSSNRRGGYFPGISQNMAKKWVLP